jgi:predicted metal-dependent hydrolase
MTRDDRGAGRPTSQLLLFEPWPVRERVSLRARRIRVDVRPNGEVVLTVPRRVPRAAAWQFLEQSRPWIERTRARLARTASPAPAPLRWDGSDRIPLRGEPVPVQVETIAGRRATARIDADGVRLQVPPSWRAQPARLRRLLVHALRGEALADARRLLDEESVRLGLRHAGLYLRDPRSRWGSCGPDGRVMLSLRLVMAPPEVFRYVVVHELCHLRWRGHGARFWGLVERQMPEYDRPYRWLREQGARLHAALPECGSA